MAQKPAGQKPHKIRVGAISVSIWRNEGEKGPFYTVTPARSYKQGEEWKESDSFGFDDLLTLAKLLDQAHSWIMDQQQADRQAGQQAA
jgi:hypothetical protein